MHPYDFLCIREELITIHIPDPEVAVQNAVGVLHIEDRRKPLVTLSMGHTSLEYKLQRLVHSILLEAGVHGHDIYRLRVRCAFADQGLERTFWNCPNPLSHDHVSRSLEQLAAGALCLADSDTINEYLFPSAWTCQAS